MMGHKNKKIVIKANDDFHLFTNMNGKVYFIRHGEMSCYKGTEGFFDGKHLFVDEVAVTPDDSRKLPLVADSMTKQIRQICSLPPLPEMKEQSVLNLDNITPKSGPLDSSIDSSKKDLQPAPSLSSSMSIPVSSSPQKNDGPGFVVKGDFNGTIFLQKTPELSGIFIKADGPIHIEQAYVTSDKSQLSDQKNITNVEKSKPSKEKFRDLFLANFNRRQQSTSSEKDKSHLQPRKP